MRYLLGFFAVIGLVILVIVLILRGLSGGGDAPKDLKSLTEYTHTDVVMQYTTTGPIVSDQERYALRITVGRSENKIEALNGYNEIVFATQTYPSNAEAYGTFLRALDLLGYNRGSDSDNLKDERGYCADGNLNLFEIKSDDSRNSVQRFWLTTCGEGNFRGDAGKINNLFIAQIPDYSAFANNVAL